MPVHNTEIAEIFDRVAEILEMEDANPFRVRAYRNAAYPGKNRPNAFFGPWTTRIFISWGILPED
jgi:DNA polymerase (family 10)